MGKIMLHGDCLVHRAAELHRLFAHLMEQPDDRVEVDMSATGRCDLSFFQLVCSAGRSFARHGKRLTLCASPPASVLAQMERCGMTAACLQCGCGACLFSGVFNDIKDEEKALPAAP
ncbi:MAG: STAS domain-containing protein [Thermodesulfobacteriota bacterium]